MPVKVSVNLSRKRSQNFDSDCVTVGIESEIQSSLSRPDEILGEIAGLFRLAERAVEQEFASLGRNTTGAPEVEPARSPDPVVDLPGGAPLASGKQVSFIRTLAKRNKLNEAQLSTHIGGILGDVILPERLTKRQAAQIIESLQLAERN
jgi:hypothetical protein